MGAEGTHPRWGQVFGCELLPEQPCCQNKTPLQWQDAGQSLPFPHRNCLLSPPPPPCSPPAPLNIGCILALTHSVNLLLICHFVCTSIRHHCLGSIKGVWHVHTLGRTLDVIPCQSSRVGGLKFPYNFGHHRTYIHMCIHRHT